MSGSRMPFEGEREDNHIKPRAVQHLNYNPYRSHVGSYPKEIQLFPLELRPVLDEQRKKSAEFYENMRSRKLEDQRRREIEMMERVHQVPERRYRIPRRPRGCDEDTCPALSRSSCSQGTDVYRNILGPTPDESILAGLQTVIEICGLADVCHLDSDSTDSRLFTSSSKNSSYNSRDGSLRRSSSESSQDDSYSSPSRHPSETNWGSYGKKSSRFDCRNSCLQQRCQDFRQLRECIPPCPLSKFPPPHPSTGQRVGDSSLAAGFHCALPNCPVPLYKDKSKEKKGTVPLGPHIRELPQQMREKSLFSGRREKPSPISSPPTKNLPQRSPSKKIPRTVYDIAVKDSNKGVVAELNIEYPYMPINNKETTTSKDKIKTLDDSIDKGTTTSKDKSNSLIVKERSVSITKDEALIKKEDSDLTYKEVKEESVLMIKKDPSVTNKDPPQILISDKETITSKDKLSINQTDEENVPIREPSQQQGVQTMSRDEVDVLNKSEIGLQTDLQKHIEPDKDQVKPSQEELPTSTMQKQPSKMYKVAKSVSQALVFDKDYIEANQLENVTESSTSVFNEGKTSLEPESDEKIVQLYADSLKPENVIPDNVVLLDYRAQDNHDKNLNDIPSDQPLPDEDKKELKPPIVQISTEESLIPPKKPQRIESYTVRHNTYPKSMSANQPYDQPSETYISLEHEILQEYEFQKKTAVVQPYLEYPSLEVKKGEIAEEIIQHFKIAQRNYIAPEKGISLIKRPSVVETQSYTLPGRSQVSNRVHIDQRLGINRSVHSLPVSEQQSYEAIDMKDAVSKKEISTKLHNTLTSKPSPVIETQSFDFPGYSQMGSFGFINRSIDLSRSLHSIPISQQQSYQTVQSKETGGPSNSKIKRHQRIVDVKRSLSMTKRQSLESGDVRIIESVLSKHTEDTVRDSDSFKRSIKEIKNIKRMNPLIKKQSSLIAQQAFEVSQGHSHWAEGPSHVDHSVDTRRTLKIPVAENQSYQTVDIRVAEDSDELAMKAIRDDFDKKRESEVTKDRCPDRKLLPEYVPGDTSYCQGKQINKDINNTICPPERRVSQKCCCSDKCCGPSQERIPRFKLRRHKSMDRKHSRVFLRQQRDLTTQLFPPVKITSNKTINNLPFGHCFAEDCSCLNGRCSCPSCRCTSKTRYIRKLHKFS